MNISDRRQFLATASGAVVTTALSNSTGFAASSPPRKMKIDLVCGRIGVKANQREEIDLAARHGFESVGPELNDLTYYSADQVLELKAEMKEKNLVFGATGMPVEFRKDPEIFAQGLKKLPGQAAALRRSGVTRIGTWIKPSSDDLTYMENFRRHTSRLREIGKILADQGLRFGLEYVGPKTLWASKRYSFVHSMAEMKDLLAAIDVPTMGLILDSWHWYTSHETGKDLLSLTQEQIVAVDLNDAPVGIRIDEQVDSKRELPAATGVIDIATFLQSLNQIGYDGPVRAEPFNAALRKLPAEEAVAATAAAMKKAFSRAALL